MLFPGSFANLGLDIFSGTVTNTGGQVANPNIFTVTPRVNLGFFEAFIPLTNSSISGFNTGFGLHLGGFYMGSGSAITAIANNSKQIDAYIGFRTAFL